jgi:hypothetical protein
MKNSKYDESSYLVDYSGKQNKVRKTEDSALQISADQASLRGSRKRSAKAMKKVTESSVFDQIKEVKIGDMEL